MLSLLMSRYPKLGICKYDIEKCIELLISTYKCKGKLLICGNGGSSADSEHIAGELMKGFLKKRPLSPEMKAKMKSSCPKLSDKMLDSLQGALPTIPLTSFSAVNTAFANDVDAELIYAQLILGLGQRDDVLLCISTSGSSKNIVAAAMTAKGLGLRIVALTGAGGGELKQLADVCIAVPETETYKVQEYHLPIYHTICAMLEDYFFGENNL